MYVPCNAYNVLALKKIPYSSFSCNLACNWVSCVLSRNPLREGSGPVYGQSEDPTMLWVTVIGSAWGV